MTYNVFSGTLNLTQSINQNRLSCTNRVLLWAKCLHLSACFYTVCCFMHKTDNDDSDEGWEIWQRVWCPTWGTTSHYLAITSFLICGCPPSVLLSSWTLCCIILSESTNFGCENDLAQWHTAHWWKSVLHVLTAHVVAKVHKHTTANYMKYSDARTAQNFVDPHTDSRCTAHEKLWTWTDADPVPAISLARILFLITAKRH